LLSVIRHVLLLFLWLLTSSPEGLGHEFGNLEGIRNGHHGSLLCVFVGDIKRRLLLVFAVFVPGICQLLRTFLKGKVLLFIWIDEYDIVQALLDLFDDAWLELPLNLLIDIVSVLSIVIRHADYLLV
jgi:hypothetical protein